MKIAVCIKQVPDTESRIRIADSRDDINKADLNYVVNPFDEYAVEEAIRIKEARGEGEVYVVIVGGEKPSEALRTCLAMGADRAVSFQDSAAKGGCSFTTAKVLAAILKKEGFDLVLCGKQAIDTDSGAVAIEVAQMLDIPHVSVVTKLEVAEDGKSAVASREVEGGAQVMETALPAVVTAQKGLNEPRYPKLKAIMMAKKKPVEELTLADIDLDASEVGAAGAKMKVVDIALPPTRAEGRVIEGEADSATPEVMRLLREEAKVI
ncbi:electron transfer flavoprotein subunit beta/FixA family protein [Candidatus Hydrogenedentota bacterium]